MKKIRSIITGCSVGLGRSIALQFAKRGVHVGLISRNLERLESLKQEIEKLGSKAVFAVCDVSDPKQVESAADQPKE